MHPLLPASVCLTELFFYLSLNGGVSCKYRETCKLHQLENYELSLWHKWSYQWGVLLSVSWFWWCQKISFHTFLTVQSVLTGTVEPTDFPWHLWIFMDLFWVSYDTKIWFLTPQDHYVILLQMGVLCSLYSDWIHMLPKGYLNLIASVILL